MENLDSEGNVLQLTFHDNYTRRVLGDRDGQKREGERDRERGEEGRKRER